MNRCFSFVTEVTTAHITSRSGSLMGAELEVEHANQIRRSEMVQAKDNLSAYSGA
jgi:hypothetical protein